MKPVLLLLIALSADRLAPLLERFDLIDASTAPRRAAEIAGQGGRIDVVLTNGTTGLTADEVDAMPKLTFVSALGVGFENLALDRCRERGIVLANGAGTNDDCVADHAFGLLLATVRAIPAFDAACRQGVWRDALPMRPQLAGKRLGVIGFGHIGQKIARRAVAFDMAIGYHSRSTRPDTPHRHFAGSQALAEWCDVLVVAAPGGPATRHLVDANVLAALGAEGFLVNIARGSVVDTEALAEALAAGRLAGAGLDVYESEPRPPDALVGLPNVVLTPHVAGLSPEAMHASLQCFLDNAALHFGGEAVKTPI